MNNKLKLFMQKHLPISIIRIIKNYIDSDNTPQIVYNLGIDALQQKKVLFSYLPDYLFMNQWGVMYSTMHVECAAFVKALLKEGCRVDLCNCNIEEGIRDDYDFIFGFGKAFRKARQLNQKAKKILYLTEKTPDFSKRKEEERIAYFYERHHIKTTIARSGLFFVDSDFDGLDGCIMIGKTDDAKLLSNIRTYTINPTGLFNDYFDITKRDLSIAKKQFLWIGSKGVIHKGLDILLDVFQKHKGLTLHIVGLNWEDRPIVSKLLGKNTIDHGYMNINSAEFCAIAENCAFIISPSCSEAVSTSVITGMNNGLIPLVSEESSFELEGIGETLYDFHVNYVDNIVNKWSNKDNDFLKIQMFKTLEYVHERHSIQKYSADIEGIISDILIKY